MAALAGLEPTTHCLEGSCSVQMSYRAVKKKRAYYTISHAKGSSVMAGREKSMEARLPLSARKYGIICAMKILGEKIFAKDAAGNLLSRVGTLFLKTPGLVTRQGIHAMQRVMWLDEVNAQRASAGLEPMTPEEEDEELSQSVDLVFTENFALIRPDPDHMDLAIKADEILQTMVSKRSIRFLNTHSAKVRNALRSRGENWRMARAPISQEDMARQIENSRVAIDTYDRIYYYNHSTGTRYLTAEGCKGFEQLSSFELRTQVKSMLSLLSSRNRFGMPEVDLFPVTTPIEIKKELKTINPDTMTDAELKDAISKVYLDWRMSMPVGLREESVDNFEWRNEMSRTLSTGPNDTAVDELIQGISPEFYRQIEWLPGARINRGQVVFDTLWDEYNRTRDPELAQVCEERVRNIIFNFVRLFSDIEYINIGRIAHSLARDPIESARRGSVYIIQLKTIDREKPHILIIRFIKWGIAEHLDEGKDLLQSILEANEYSDYILDRRLMCQQLGMRLPTRIGYGQFPERYNSRNQYNGTTVMAYYNVRNYVPGTASDKIPPARFRNPAFALKFASIMGEAAATDLIVGRRSTETKENLFDKFYEVVQMGEDGLPAKIQVTSHAGSFVNYLHTFEDSVAPYANVVRRRKDFVTDYATFTNAFVESFERKLRATQKDYHDNKQSFDELFMHRPFDVAGSGAYRWAKTLERLEQCDCASVVARLREAIES